MLLPCRIHCNVDDVYHSDETITDRIRRLNLADDDIEASHDEDTFDINMNDDDSDNNDNDEHLYDNNLVSDPDSYPYIE